MSFYKRTSAGREMFDELYFQGPYSNKCLVLDLDNTLVRSFTDDDIENSWTHLKELRIFDDPTLYDLRSRVYILNLLDIGRSRKGSGDVEKLWGIVRPGAFEFIDFIHRYFQDIYVFSAGHKKYVEQIVDFLFKDYRKPSIIYSREDCVDDNNHHMKPLTKIYHATQGSCSYLNTYIIDDIQGSFACNMDNGILIPKYDPEPEIEAMRKNDDALAQIKDWLMKPEVAYARDIRSLNKKEIFVYRKGGTK